MKHVVVTGAAGLLGRHVAAAFRQAGWRVTATDRRDDGAAIPVVADLLDEAEARRLVDGADCVAHIASIPRPVGYDARDVFDTNMGLMYSVLGGMEATGVSRLVFASSFSILGLPFAPRPVDIAYLPIDEGHPAGPQDVYAVTKWLGEEMVDAWVRRTGGSAVSIRMPWIQTAEGFARDVVARRTRPESHLDLWSYIDARDAGEAFVLAAEAPTTGNERLYIAAADTYSEEPTDDLVARHYPDVRYGGVAGPHGAVISTEKARTTIGFQPRHGWREYAGVPTEATRVDSGVGHPDEKG